MKAKTKYNLNESFWKMYDNKICEHVISTVKFKADVLYGNYIEYTLKHVTRATRYFNVGEDSLTEKNGWFKSKNALIESLKD